MAYCLPVRTKPPVHDATGFPRRPLALRRSEKTLVPPDVDEEGAADGTKRDLNAEATSLGHVLTRVQELALPRVPYR